MKTTGLIQRTKKILFLLVCWPFDALAEIHNLTKYCAAMSGISDFPRYMEITVVDAKACSHYNSITQRYAPMNQCLKDIFDQQFWDSNTEESKRMEKDVTTDFESIQKSKTGVHVFQKICHCEWNDQSNKTKVDVKAGYDGEDYAWGTDLPNKASSESKEDIWCCRDLQPYVKNGEECLNRKEPPKVSLFNHSSSNSLVVCHATGFYPKEMKITWKRDGQEMQELVIGNLSGTLPNGDGTFQRRAVVRVTPEERRKSTYTCEVAHISGLIINMLTYNPQECKKGVGAMIAGGLLVVVFFAHRKWKQTQGTGASESATALMPQTNSVSDYSSVKETYLTRPDDG